MPNDTKEEVRELIRKGKELGVELSFGVNKGGTKVLNAELKDCYINLLNKKRATEAESQSLLTRCIQDAINRTSEKLPNKFSLDLSSAEAYKKRKDTLSEAMDNFFDSDIFDKSFLKNLKKYYYTTANALRTF